MDVTNAFKRSAIPASGYMYQTLVGIQVLCDWLDSPGLYEWVQFEADDQVDARGLDDIVAQRTDKLLELTQVKFTVDPFDPANTLSWDWLTERKGQRGKSLLEKWSSAAFRVGLENTAGLRLITNRRPDADFAAHLHGGKMSVDALPGPLRTEIEAHVGGNLNADCFFGRFEFVHSYTGYESLDRTVSAALEERHTDHLGWLMLYRRAIDWSIHKNSPAPDGHITLDILRSTISERQPRPLDQAFRVPAGYLPPDAEFADNFLRQAESGEWDLRVLWGSPGQGKSTFLSYVCKRLEERDLPFVRHHYFLDLQDTSERFSLKSVAHSLIVQMLENEGEALAHLVNRPEDNRPEMLREWITACGEAYAAQGKRFFVVIDGLDHVWRENDEKIAPLESLFVYLLPLPPNTTLILGTQRVDTSRLPARLNRHLVPEHWEELPRMRLPSVKAWLLALHEAGTFEIDDNVPLEDGLSQLSSAFERVSGGHPLVLTYIFLALTRDRRVLNLPLLENGTPPPVGDVRDYYQALWQRLPCGAKDALHLMAEDAFVWPVGALENCLGIAGFNLEAEVGYLLATVDAGLVAFHGSLYVFITSLPNHALRVNTLLPKVQRWLEADAPPYLRWAWLWLCQSRCGEHAELIAGTTRSWAVEALANAYPAQQIERILKGAEEIALKQRDYEQAIRKRALKTRILNLSYQLDNADTLENCALRLTEDPYRVLLLASEVSQSNIAGLHRLAMLYLALDQTDHATKVQERMRQRINDRIQSRVLTANEYNDFTEKYLEVAAGTGHYETKHVVRLLRCLESPADIFSNFLNRAGRAVDLTCCMTFSREPMPVQLRRVLEIEAIRTAAWSGAILHEWDEFKYFKAHPLSACWSLLYCSKHEALLPRLPAHEALSMEYGNYNGASFAQYLHFIFFTGLARAIQRRGAQAPNSLCARANRSWLNTALDRLASIANVCGAILSRGEAPAFSLVYQLIGLERPDLNDSANWADVRALNEALVLITADIFFLSRPRSRIECIAESEWQKCRGSRLFAEWYWREKILTRHYLLLNQDDVAKEIQDQERSINNARKLFNEKCSELASLCYWAEAYGLKDLSARLLKLTYRCATGYGWRKDSQLPRLLETVEDVSQHCAAAAKSAIIKLAPIYTNIDEMTERSGANRSDLADLLLKLMPQAYIRYYRFWLDRCEWYEAERTFAAFAKQANFQSPAALASAAFLWDPQTKSAVKGNSAIQSDVLLKPWKSTKLEGLDKKDSYTSPEDPPADESTMPSLNVYPPEAFPEFLIAVDATQQYQLRRRWITEWFNYWVEQGRSSALLDALAAAHRRNLLKEHGTHLFDLVFSLSLKLQGPKRAFVWLVDAHRYRMGWSAHYYGRPESARRLALVAKHYPKRWAEFVALSTEPISEPYEEGLVIPIEGLVSLLLQVGEIRRAVSILDTLVDITLEEFDMQPLGCPSWLEGSVQ